MLITCWTPFPSWQPDGFAPAAGGAAPRAASPPSAVLPTRVAAATAAFPPFTSANAGALGDVNTTVLLGGNDVEADKWHNGGRFTAGTWLGCDQRFGIEGSYFFLNKLTDRQSVSASDTARACSAAMAACRT